MAVPKAGRAHEEASTGPSSGKKGFTSWISSLLCGGSRANRIDTPVHARTRRNGGDLIPPGSSHRTSRPLPIDPSTKGPIRNVYDSRRGRGLPDSFSPRRLANNDEGSQYRSASGAKVSPGDLLPAVTSRTHPEMRMSSREMRDVFKSMARLADQRRLTGKHVQRGGKLICVGVNKNDLERAHIHVPLSRAYPWLAKAYSCGPVGSNSGRTAATTATPGGSAYYGTGSFAGNDTPTLPKSSLGGNGQVEFQKTTKYRYPRSKKVAMEISRAFKRHRSLVDAAAVSEEDRRENGALAGCKDLLRGSQSRSSTDLHMCLFTSNRPKAARAWPFRSCAKNNKRGYEEQSDVEMVPVEETSLKIHIKQRSGKGDAPPLRRGSYSKKTRMEIADLMRQQAVCRAFAGSHVLVKGRLVSSGLNRLHLDRANVRQVAARMQELHSKFARGEISRAQFQLEEYLCQCEQFPLWCSPIALAELGAGFPVYFDLIKALRNLIVVLFLISIIMLISNAKADSMALMIPLEQRKIPSSWLTPGNHGYHGSEGSELGLAMILMVLVTMAFSVHYSRRIRVLESTCDALTDHPNDYAILVSGLPHDATDESEIGEFFRNNALRDRPIVKALVCFDIAQLFDAVKQKKRVEMDLAEDPGNPHLQAELVAANEALASVAPDREAKIQSSGHAVVIFRYQKDHRHCLRHWNGIWRRLIDLVRARCHRCPVKASVVLVSSRLKVERAPNPTDFQWENLRVTPKHRRTAQLTTLTFISIVIAVCAVACFGLQKLQESLTEDGGSAILSLLPALTIAILNWVVTKLAYKSVIHERHATVSAKDSSIMVKLSFAYVMNTALILFAVNADPSQWYRAGGMVPDVFMTILVNSILPPAVAFLDLGGLIRKYVIKEIDPAKSKLKQEKYAYAMKTYFLGMTFAPVLPVLLPLVALGLTLQYCSSKYLLLRKCKRPYTQSATLAKHAMFLVELSGVLLAVMDLVFIRPSVADSQLPTFRAQMSTLILLSSAVLVLPLSILRYVCCTCLCQQSKASLSHAYEKAPDYYTVQYLWPRRSKYHMTNPAYRGLPKSLNPENLNPSTTSSGPSILQRAQTQALQGNFNDAVTNYAVNAAEVEFVGGQDITVDQTPMGCWIGPATVGNTTGASLIGKPAGRWEWRDSTGEWLPLPHAAALIADEAQRCGVPNTVIELGNETFMANVMDGTMVSLLTQQKTEIRRAG
ncbi:Elongation factor-like GTPase 1 [Perkinsus olseni]|uniref:Elongation factor-like GTPase 1 n=1 Tax=Perkinsus olseni TaxID=32597 RepID=A0A7J6MKA7_PEROL|nr:Elongation factor-like GTPase 1 [Perkinsus olseni]